MDGVLKSFFSVEGGAVPGRDDVGKLTDRQKWAYAWMPKSGIVLEVGSSSAPLIRFLPDKSVYAFVVDVEGLSLQNLGEEQWRIQPIQASATRLPFPSGSVDTVLLLDILEHTEEERKMVDEVERVLRPGGKLILSVPNRGAFRFGRSGNSGKHRRYSDADLTRLLFLKFRVLQKHYGGLFVYPLMLAANNVVRKYFRRDWRLFRRLGDLDYHVSWGRWSHNVMILAEKL